VIKDFFADYGDAKLPNGAPAKLAIYFPQTDDIGQYKPAIDDALVKAGQSPAVCIVNTSDENLTKPADIDAFNRLNDATAPHRVVLLVNKGTEGWNCPSLFACALARRLRSSNNFVLQAATRCLRQVPGNDRKARVYLSTDNFGILDRQLRETYGETIADLNKTHGEQVRCRIILRKLDIPPLVVTQTVRTVVRKGEPPKNINLTRPKDTGKASLTRATFTVAEQQATYGVLRQLGDSVVIESLPETRDKYAVACELAGRYRLDVWAVLVELRRLYGTEDIPLSHEDELSGQIEQQIRDYEVREEKVDVALALVKPDGFDREEKADGTVCYTAQIVYPKSQERYLMRCDDMMQTNPRDLSFHYDPYHFDSNPEKSFLEQMLIELNVSPNDVEDIYFTGALTDPNKTDFFVWYNDEKGKPRRYTPDFIIRKKAPKGRARGSGKVLIVEVKDADFENDGTDGRSGRKAVALQAWEKLDPKRLKYEMVCCSKATVPGDQLQPFLRWSKESD